MAQSLLKVYVHITFGTYEHNDTLPHDGLASIHSYIAELIKGCGCQPIIVGGVESHVHVFFELSANITIADFMKRIKIQSTKWIREVYPKSDFYKWQRGYAAMSVSQSGVSRVYEYIRNQEEHHRRKDFDTEVKEWSEAYGMDYVDDYWCKP